MARAFGGLIFYPAFDLTAPTASVGAAAGQYGLTRNAAGDWSWNNVAGAATVVFAPDDANMARPYITGYSPYPDGGTAVFPSSNEYQEVFGTSAGGPGNPFSGVAQGATLQGNQFLTALVPHGLALIDVVAVYSVQTAALTAATIGVTRNVFVENTATAQTTPLAATAVALTTTTSATTPHVQKVALAQPLIWESADMSDLVIELSITAAATSAIRVYGVGAHYVVRYS